MSTLLTNTDRTHNHHWLRHGIWGWCRKIVIAFSVLVAVLAAIAGIADLFLKPPDGHSLFLLVALVFVLWAGSWLVFRGGVLVILLAVRTARFWKWVGISLAVVAVMVFSVLGVSGLIDLLSTTHGVLIATLIAILGMWVTQK
jgi:hypothetical protein